MKNFLILFLGATSLPFALYASVDAEIHKKCIKANDYLGCVKAQNSLNDKSLNNKKTRSIETPSKFTYEPWSVQQLKIRGEYGRYITFIGRTENVYGGTDGYVLQGYGNTWCNNYGGQTFCNSYGSSGGYVPGKQGGTQISQFVYELDCIDMTFDRKGDLKNADGFKLGWMKVYKDPTAMEVADKYCPKISSLPKHTGY